MRLSVADTGPLQYLVLIGEIGLVSSLMDEVLIPPEILDELGRPRTPALVRALDSGAASLAAWAARASRQQ